MMQGFVLLCLMASSAALPLLDDVAVLVQSGVNTVHSPRAQNGKSKAAMKHHSTQTDSDEEYGDEPKGELPFDRSSRPEGLDSWREEINAWKEDQKTIDEMNDEIDNDNVDIEKFNQEIDEELKEVSVREAEEDDIGSRVASCGLLATEIGAAVYGLMDASKATEKACDGAEAGLAGSEEAISWDCKTNRVGLTANVFGLIATLLDVPTECFNADCSGPGSWETAGEKATASSSYAGGVAELGNFASAAMDIDQACVGRVINGTKTRSNDDLALGDGAKHWHYITTIFPLFNKVKELFWDIFSRTETGAKMVKGRIGNLKPLESHPFTTCEKTTGLFQTTWELVERVFQDDAHKEPDDTHMSDLACAAAISKLTASVYAVPSVACKFMACKKDEKEPRLIPRQKKDTKENLKYEDYYGMRAFD